MLDLRDPPRGANETVLVLPDSDGIDPLKAELRRCQSLGEAGGRDERCLHAWALERSRFFLMQDPVLQNPTGDAASSVPSTPAPNDAAAVPTPPIKAN